MNRFTFTYSYLDSEQADLLGQVDDTCEVFTTTVEASTLTEAFSLFYDPTTGVEFDSVPTIHDIVMDSPADDYDRMNNTTTC